MATKPGPAPRCRLPRCSRAVYARGLCEPHYEDLARSRGPFAPTAPEPTKESR